MTITIQPVVTVWKPTRLRTSSLNEEEEKTDSLNKTVLSTLNKLTPENFDTLVNKVQELQVDTEEQLQNITELVFNKAVNEPQYSVAYAGMCKELSMMQVSDGQSSSNLQNLIINRCRNEFEKAIDDSVKAAKLDEIDNCSDPRKKKQLQMAFDKEEWRMRKKAVGNIKFIGELFKQDMLSINIIASYIQHLLQQRDSESLECLCKLLTTIGENLEHRGMNLSDWFDQLKEMMGDKEQLSLRMRFMLQDVIELRENKWILRRNEDVPKTIDQIISEFEAEQPGIWTRRNQLNQLR